MDLLGLLFKMNYIELINNFWAYTEEEDLTSSDTSMYFALLKYNNSLNWIKEFRCDYAVICQYARVSKNTFYRSLDNLQDLGLIKYQKGQRNGLKPKITILKKKNKKGIIREQKRNNEGTKEEQNEEQNGNLYKPINSKPINLKTFKHSLMSEIKISDVESFLPNEVKYFEIAEEFRKLFIQNQKEREAPTSDQEKAKYKNYVDPIRLAFEKDKINKEQFIIVYKYLSSVNGEFWKSNILSTDKLRKQMSQLVSKAKEQPKKNNNQGFIADADYFKRVANSETAKNFKLK